MHYCIWQGIGAIAFSIKSMIYKFGTHFASIVAELVARVPASQGVAGPRATTGRGDIPPGARRDKSPGDLVSQGIGGTMVIADPF